ncbi:hypothetical protein [Variovorax rhizosphaerae]|uniref:EexN family lipoprotein n=1 Tax=Variovorax rhizosphaerae TaxID=1836200 RepID=A0ABU8X084_9BURK
MMSKQFTAHAVLFFGAVMIFGCSKQEPKVEAMKFDPKLIAAEADNGNLGPLKELNAACSSEFEKNGKRGSACATQDDVGALRKPLKLNF